MKNKTDCEKWFTLEIRQGMAASRVFFQTKSEAIHAGKAMLRGLHVKTQVWRGLDVSPTPENPALWTGGNKGESY